MTSKQKTIGDVVLKGSEKSFPLGTIRKGTIGPEGEKKIICYAIPRHILKDKDIDKIRKSSQDLVSFEHENVNTPEKVVFTKSSIYFIYLTKKKQTFIEAQENNSIKLPSFFTKLASCASAYHEVIPKTRVILPQSLYFDKAGGFVYQPLGCEYLLKKKLCIENMKKEKEDSKHDYPPEMLEKGKTKGITPETSLVYSIGALFARVNTTREEVDSRLNKKSIGLINQMLQPNPDQRPTLESCVNFKWTTSKQVSFDGNVKEESKTSSKVSSKSSKASSNDTSDKRKWQEKGKEKKTGNFDNKELETLKHAICRYVQQHSLGENGLLKLITHSKDKDIRGAWTQISEILPDRTVQSCHNAARNHFHPGNYKGRWTEDEEQELLRLVEIKGRKWQEIANELDRTPTNVRDKYKSMGEENSEYRVKGLWSPKEIVDLLKLVQKSSKTQFLLPSVNDWLKEEENKDQTSEYTGKKRRNPYSKLFESGLSDHIDYEEAQKINHVSLDWTPIAKAMKTRSKDDCKNIWYKQIYNSISSQVEFDDDEDEALVNAILVQDPESENAIDFSKVKNGRSQEDNRSRWKQLSKAASGRALRTTSQLVKDVRAYLKQIKAGRLKKYEYKKGLNTGKNELLELFRNEYK